MGSGRRSHYINCDYVVGNLSPVVLVPSPDRTPARPASPTPAEALGQAFLLGYQGATRAAYRRDLRAWFDWCAIQTVDPLDAHRAHVDAYARVLGEVGGRSPATVARHLSTLFYR